MGELSSLKIILRFELKVICKVRGVTCLTIISLTGALFRTTFTDPGIIPRASHDEAAYIEKQIGK